MEHHPLNDRDLTEAIHRNLAATYMAIGGAGAGVETISTPEFVACRSHVRHPVSNFAVCSDPSSEALENLVAWIGPRTPYNLYTFAPIGHEPPETRLNRSGFRHASMLTTLGWADPKGEPLLEIDQALSIRETAEVARFMSHQFFGRQSSEVQRIVAQSTASSGIPVAWFRDRGLVVGAVLLHITDGLMGIYNLCIDEPLRSRGYGRAAVSSLAHWAGERGLALGLQCEVNLVEWYERSQLNALANVDVWTISQKNRANIG